ncbi:CotS family spore coat protein [Thermobrachium celere]|uniref:Uncharacterized protein, related to B.subtilis spore coat protein COTS n=2 Tax=Thermobrachium TaxID=150333 RepID=R7RRT2_9CLOT|nr:CotS family spore coat protein [Thermobrachium celere]CDF58056.1 Uncharacterized protein, related to B.subtilis spore coat protein COTS [Thermobrachium celere DSM 8682]
MEYEIVNKQTTTYTAEDIKNVLNYYPYEITKIENIKIKDSDKPRAVYKVYTNNGIKCLKKMYYDKEVLLFIYSIIEWLNYHGIKCPRFLKTKNGLRYVYYKGNYFVLMDWIDGRKCDYDNIEDVKDASKNLAKIHNATKNFRSISGSKVIYEDKDIYDSYSKHFLQLLDSANKAFYYKDSFSKLFIEYADYYIESAKDSIYLLSQIDFSNDNVRTSLCHYDYVNKNIIFSQNDIYIIDFDKAKIDYSINDFYVFIKRIMKRKNTSWNFEIFKTALESYESIRPLNQIEFKLLIAQLMFPNKIWKLTRDYYKNIQHCNKKAFYRILKELVSQKNNHQQFMLNIFDYFNNKY